MLLDELEEDRRLSEVLTRQELRSMLGGYTLSDRGLELLDQKLGPGVWITEDFLAAAREPRVLEKLLKLKGKETKIPWTRLDEQRYFPESREERSSRARKSRLVILEAASREKGWTGAEHEGVLEKLNSYEKMMESHEHDEAQLSLLGNGTLSPEDEQMYRERRDRFVQLRLELGAALDLKE
jgi:hypothetical protein